MIWLCPDDKSGPASDARRDPGRSVHRLWQHYDLIVMRLNEHSRETAARPIPNQVTTIPVWMPVMDAVRVSVALTRWVPAVRRVTLKVWTPALAALKV